MTYILHRVTFLKTNERYTSTSSATNPSARQALAASPGDVASRKPASPPKGDEGNGEFVLNTATDALAVPPANLGETGAMAISAQGSGPTGQHIVPALVVPPVWQVGLTTCLPRPARLDAAVRLHSRYLARASPVDRPRHRAWRRGQRFRGRVDNDELSCASLLHDSGGLGFGSIVAANAWQVADSEQARGSFFSFATLRLVPRASHRARGLLTAAQLYLRGREGQQPKIGACGACNNLLDLQLSPQGTVRSSQTIRTDWS